MTNLYLNPSLKKRVENVEPRKECLDFILNYSKSLKIVCYKDLQFGSIQN